jgi:hypothetical protein
MNRHDWHERKTICHDIFLLSDRQWGTEHQYLLSRFLGISILQLFINYRIYDYNMMEIQDLAWDRHKNVARLEC